MKISDKITPIIRDNNIVKNFAKKWRNNTGQNTIKNFSRNEANWLVEKLLWRVYVILLYEIDILSYLFS